MASNAMPSATHFRMVFKTVSRSACWGTSGPVGWAAGTTAGGSGPEADIAARLSAMRSMAAAISAAPSLPGRTMLCWMLGGCTRDVKRIKSDLPELGRDPWARFECTDDRLSVEVKDPSLDRLMKLRADIVPLSMSILPADGKVCD